MNYFSTTFILIALMALIAGWIIFILISPILETRNISQKMTQIISDKDKLANKIAVNGAEDQGLLSSLNDAENSLRMKLMQAGKRKSSDIAAHGTKKMLYPVGVAVLGLLVANSMEWNFIVWGVLGAVFGYFLPDIMLSNSRTKRYEKIRKAYPDFLDLLLICINSMSVEMALNRVLTEMMQSNRGRYTDLIEEVSLLVTEMAYLSDQRKAFENFMTRISLPEVRATMLGIIQADRYGTSMGQTIRAIVQDLRDTRLQTAEAKAASLGSKMTMPMVAFFLPVLFIIILAPAILVAMKEFTGGIL